MCSGVCCLAMASDTSNQGVQVPTPAFSCTDLGKLENRDTARTCCFLVAAAFSVQYLEEGDDEASEITPPSGNNQNLRRWSPDDADLRQKLEHRARRFGLPPPVGNTSKQSLATKRKLLDTPLRSAPLPPPSKRLRYAFAKSGAVARTATDAVALLPGQWRCCVSGKAQLLTVKRSIAGHLVCVIWERGVVSNQWESKRKPFSICPSADGKDLLWGRKGNVWLDLQSCSQTHAVWLSNRGKTWRWHR